ncbi:DNA helicase [Fusarium longipes]|uniref:DNA helicase n=1 Tax=Fusarium longipes TaxID=694270 RepID=A0A395SD71_9HYPO|nr:DNA helicase [Fusarium longipes]
MLLLDAFDQLCKPSEQRILVEALQDLYKRDGTQQDASTSVKRKGGSTDEDFPSQRYSSIYQDIQHISVTIFSAAISCLFRITQAARDLYARRDSEETSRLRQALPSLTPYAFGVRNAGFKQRSPRFPMAISKRIPTALIYALPPSIWRNFSRLLTAFLTLKTAHFPSATRHNLLPMRNRKSHTDGGAQPLQQFPQNQGAAWNIALGANKLSDERKRPVVAFQFIKVFLTPICLEDIGIYPTAAVVARQSGSGFALLLAHLRPGPGFTGNPKRLCVMLSRHKSSLIIVGDINVAQHDKTRLQITDDWKIVHCMTHVVGKNEPATQSRKKNAKVLETGQEIVGLGTKHIEMLLKHTSNGDDNRWVSALDD